MQKRLAIICTLLTLLLLVFGQNVFAAKIKPALRFNSPEIRKAILEGTVRINLTVMGKDMEPKETFVEVKGPGSVADFTLANLPTGKILILQADAVKSDETVIKTIKIIFNSTPNGSDIFLTVDDTSTVATEIAELVAQKKKQTIWQIAETKLELIKQKVADRAKQLGGIENFASNAVEKNKLAEEIANDGIAVSNVNAINGKVTVLLNGVLVGTPQVSDFTFKQSIDGGAEITITPTNIAWNPDACTAVFTTALVNPGTNQQSVVISAAYKGTDSVKASPFIVEPTGGIVVKNATATNQLVTAALSAKLIIAPEAKDFTVKRSINGGAETLVTVTGIDWDAISNTANLSIQGVQPTSDDQVIVISVAYKNTAAVTAPAFTIAAGSAIQISGVSALNGGLTVTLSGKTANPPVISDFAIKQSVDAGAETQVTPIAIDWNAATNTGQIIVPEITATADEHSVSFSAAYKDTPAVKTSPFILEAKPPICVKEVEATTKTITVTLSGKPVGNPIVADFSVKESINGGAETLISPTAISWDAATNTAVLTIPEITATADDQRIVISVSYKGTPAVSGSTCIVSSNSPIHISSLSIVENGKVKAVLSGLPLEAPTVVDFSVKQAVNAGAENSVAVNAITWNPATRTAILPIPVVSVGADETSLSITAAYKDTPSLTANAVIEANPAIKISSMTAENQKVTIVLSGKPAINPTIDSFAVKKSVNGGNAISVIPINLNWDAGTKTAVVTIPAVTATADDQRVVISAAYKSTQTVNANAFVVEASPAISVSSVSGSNGSLKVVLSGLPLNAPEIKDFTVTQSVNGGTATSITPISYTWNAIAKTMTFTVPRITAIADEQSISYSVAYKSTAPSTTNITIDASPGIYAKTVTAVNGSVTVVLSGKTATAPAPGDFSIKKSINGGLLTAVTASSVGWNENTKTAVVTIPAVTATADDQRVVISAAYKSTQTVNANAFVVEASPAISVSSVSGSNGSLKVVLSGLPLNAPEIKDFTVTQSVNGGTATSITPTSYTWNAIAKTMTFTVPRITAIADEQSISYSVAYKSTAPSTVKVTIDANPLIRVNAVTAQLDASSGKIVALLSGKPLNTPTVGDFTIKKSVNGGAEVTVPATQISWDQGTNAATLTIPGVPVTGDDQRIVLSIAYKTTPAVSASTCIVNAGSAIHVSGISVTKDGIVTVTLSGTPAETPKVGDFAVKQSIDAALAQAVTPLTYSWDAATKKATFSITVPKAQTDEQLLTVSVAYKGTPSLSASAIIDASPTLRVINVYTASDGSITFMLNGRPALAPVIGDFTVKQYINGASPVPVPITAIQWNWNEKTVILTIKKVTPTVDDQKVITNVAYKNTPSINANMFVVLSSATIHVTEASVSKEGILTATLSGLPATAIQESDFSIKQSINGGKAETIKPTVFSWNVTTKKAVISIPRISSTIDEQSAIISVAYKDSPFVDAALVVDALQAIRVSSMTAANGTATVTLSAKPALAPRTVDFTVKQSINGKEAVTVSASTVNWDAETKKAVLAIPQVSATADEQSVVVSAAYKGTSTVTAGAFTVNPSPPIHLHSANAANGLLTLILSGLPLLSPNINDFTITQLIDGGSETVVRPSSIIWDASTKMVKLSIPKINAITNEQLVTFKASYKGTDTVNANMVLEANPPIQVTSANAVNGLLTVQLSGRTASVPTADAFSVKQSINGSAAVAVTVNAVDWDATAKVAKLSVPQVMNNADEQKVVLTVAYRSTSAVSANSFVITASPIIHVNSVNVSNGTVKAVLSGKPLDTPKQGDFTLNSSVNAGVQTVMTASSASWDANTKTVTLTVPKVTLTSDEQSLTVTAAYKQTAGVSGSAILDANPAIKVNTAAASNGLLTLTLSGKPWTKPDITSFAVMQSINGGTAKKAGVLAVDWDESTKTVKLAIAEVAATDDDQRVITSVAYKNSASVTANEFIVRASTEIHASNVTVTNGRVTVVLSGLPVTAPQVSDFAVVQSVDGAPSAAAQVNSVEWNASIKTAILSITPISASTDEHRLVVSVAYNGTSALSASCVVDASPAIYVKTLSAVNKLLTVALSGKPSSTPSLDDFKVKQSINGGTQATLTPSAIDWNAIDKIALITVPEIIASADDQSIVMNVAYKNTASTNAQAFTVAANPPIHATAMTAINGTLTVDLSGKPLTAPSISDFNITQSIDGGIGATVIASKLSWDAATKKAVITLPLITAIANEQNVVFKLSYKGTATLTASIVIDANPPIRVSSINAVNGFVTLQLSSKPAVSPQIADFKVTKAINGAVAVSVTPLAIEWNSTDRTVKLTVPEIIATADEQSVVMGAAYKNTASMNANPFVVAASSPIVVSSVNASNGSVKIVLTGLPAVTPVLSDFSLTQSINAGAAAMITGSNFRWDAATKSVTLTIPLIQPAVSNQSVIITAAYKSTTPVSSSAFVVEGLPVAPSGFTVKVDDRRAILTWTAVNTATSYKVYKSDVSGSGYVEVDPGVSKIGTSYNVTGLTNGKTYYFVVRSVNSGGEGQNSNEVSATPGKIVFVSERDGNKEIYLMNADGTDQTRLTNGLAADDTPVWSPNGSKITFVSGRDGNQEIYVMNADGTNQVRLTNNNAFDGAPVWSPDGSKIAFVSERDGNREIYVMNADGSNQTNLTHTWDYEESPVWTPDGSRIVFVSLRDQNDEIYIMNADGSNPVNLTKNLATDYDPAISPTGNKIVFTSFYREGKPVGELYTMNLDGSSLTKLTTTGDWIWNTNAAWSPDGSKVVLTSYRDGNDEVFTVNANGSGLANLTNNAAYDNEAVWSPAGSKILFVSYRDGGSGQIYTFSPDGTGIVKLTSNGPNYTPSWKP